jgi:folate-binding protein YgfZ
MKIAPPALCHRYLPGCVLQVSGPDAATFLQGQFTNDLSKLPPGGSAYGLWLDRRGRVIADAQVILSPKGDSFSIASPGSPAAVVARHLGDHLIADEVDIADKTAEFRGVALVGERSGAWLAAQPATGLRFPGRRAAVESWEWIYPAADAAEVDAALAGLAAADAPEMERLRIEAGIPAVPADIGPADLPNEGGLDEVAISYSKGCYIGQEVMARVKNLGRVRRRLVRVAGPGAAPTVPAALWLADRRAGELRSAVPTAAGFAGLALVPVDAAEAGQALALAAGGPAGLTVT